MEVTADQFSIRPASMNDAGALYAILTECGLDMRDRLGLTHWVPAYPRHLFEEQVTKGDVYSVEARESGETVATFTASRDAPFYFDLSLWERSAEPSLYLARLTVLPRFRHRGIGRVCVAAVERMALERACLSVRLDAVEQHVEILGWYLGLGYRGVCRYESHGNRMVGLEKLVSPRMS